MKLGRWTAVVACTVVVGIATGALSLVLYRVIERGTLLSFAPYLALAVLALAPFVASFASGSATPFAAGAGGLALGIGATVVAAALNQGGNGVLPLVLGIAVAGAIALRGTTASMWARLVAIVLLVVYAAFSERLISAVFVYPALGIADEFADVITGRRSRRLADSQRASVP